MDPRHGELPQSKLMSATGLSSIREHHHLTIVGRQPERELLSGENLPPSGARSDIDSSLPEPGELHCANRNRTKRFVMEVVGSRITPSDAKIQWKSVHLPFFHARHRGRACHEG